VKDKAATYKKEQELYIIGVEKLSANSHRGMTDPQATWDPRHQKAAMTAQTV
jgi:hypothetical protein